MKNNYTYPVIISENEVGGWDIVFPDFNNATTCATKNDDVIEVAQDLLALMISDAECNKRKLPSSSVDKEIAQL